MNKFKVGDHIQHAIPKDTYTRIITHINEDRIKYNLIRSNGDVENFHESYTDAFTLNKEYMLKKQFDEEMQEIINS